MEHEDSGGKFIAVENAGIESATFEWMHPRVAASNRTFLSDFAHRIPRTAEGNLLRVRACLLVSSGRHAA